MYFDTLRRPDAEIEHKFSFPQRALKFWSNSLLLAARVSKYTSRLVPRICLKIFTLN